MAARAADSSAAAPDELTPRQLADAWKKAGGFDRLRKQLLQDFLASPEKDALMSELGSLLPTLLATTPALARHPRQARLAETTSLLDKRGALSGPVIHLENRLQSGKGVGRTVQRELTRVLCEKKGLPYVEDDEGDDEVAEQSRDETPLVAPMPDGPAKVAASEAPQTAFEEAVLPSAAPTHAKQPSPTPVPPAPATTAAPTTVAGAADALVTAEPTGEAASSVPIAPAATLAAEDVEMHDAAASASALGTASVERAA